MLFLNADAQIREEVGWVHVEFALVERKNHMLFWLHLNGSLYVRLNQSDKKNVNSQKYGNEMLDWQMRELWFDQQ